MAPGTAWPWGGPAAQAGGWCGGGGQARAEQGQDPAQHKRQAGHQSHTEDGAEQWGWSTGLSGAQLVIPTIPHAVLTAWGYGCPGFPGPGRAADAISEAIYEELDYTLMLEYQEVPSGSGAYTLTPVLGPAQPGASSRGGRSLR